jgi:hypothetical protein
MTSGLAPLVIGFAVVGLLLIPIALFFAFRRIFKGIRLRPKRGSAGGSDGRAATQDWVYRPRARATLHVGDNGSDTAEDDGPRGTEEAPADSNARVAQPRERQLDRTEATGDETQRQARELLEEAEREAKAVVAAAQGERTRILTELARDYSAVEETRTELAQFLTDVLDEIDGTRPAGEPSDNVHELGEARGMKKAASADQ